MPSPEAVLWWCMWPNATVQSPPWEAFRTGVTVHGQEGQSEWISGDQLCVQTPAVVSLKLDLNQRTRRTDLKSFDVTDSGSSAET